MLHKWTPCQDWTWAPWAPVSPGQENCTKIRGPVEWLCIVQEAVKVLTLIWLSDGLWGILLTLNLLVLNRPLWNSLLRNEMKMAIDVILISRCERKDLFFTTWIPQPSSGGNAYVDLYRLSEAQTCKQVIWLDFRAHCHRRASRVSELVFFTGNHPEGPVSRRVGFVQFACRSRKT